MDDKILLAHGSGGKLSHDLIESFLTELSNPVLDKLDDTDPDELTPRAALDLIYKLKALLRSE